MNIFTYIERKFYGLPVYDSKELIAAKRYRSSHGNDDSKFTYDLHVKEVDPFMFGAISPMSDDDDLLDSSQLEKRASEIYKLCNK